MNFLNPSLCHCPRQYPPPAPRPSFAMAPVFGSRPPHPLLTLSWATLLYSCSYPVLFLCLVHYVLVPYTRPLDRHSFNVYRSQYLLDDFAPASPCQRCDFFSYWHFPSLTVVTGHWTVSSPSPLLPVCPASYAKHSFEYLLCVTGPAAYFPVLLRLS